MRVKFEFPEPSIFKTNYTLSISDINYGNHLGNDKVLSIANEARMRYLKSLGYKHELDFGGDVGMIVADAAIMFRNEGFHGDELEIAISIANPHKFGFDMFYQLTKKEGRKEIARVKTAILFIDYKTKKLTGVPEGF